MKRTPPKNRLPVEILTRAECLALIGTFSNAPTGVRNAAIVAVFWRCGLRCRELRNLLLRDLDTERRVVNVRRGKGDKARMVPIDDQALARVQLWIASRKQLPRVTGQRLFCTHDGTPLEDTYIRRMLRIAGRRAGIEKRVHPHGLRHTYACELDRERVPLAQISKLLGHAKSATTSIYIDHVGSQDLVDTIASREDWDPKAVKRS